MVPHPPPRGLRRGGAPGLQRPGLPPARAPRRRPGPPPGPRPRAAADRGGDAAPSPTSPEGLRALAHSSLKRQNVPGLKARAKALGIKGISKMKKAGVIEALLDFGDLDPSETPEQVLARVRAGAPVNPAAATLDGDQVARRLRELAEKDIFALREVASQYGLMGVTRMLKREIVSHVMTLEFGPASAGAVKAFYDTELEPEFREEDLEIPDDPTQLAAWNTYQLRAAARAQGIPQATQLRKSELIAALSGAKGAAPPAAGEFAFLEGLEAEGADAANRPGPDVDPLSSDLFQMDDALDAWASQDFLSQVGGGPPSTLQTTLTVGLVCGGASAERGISLNTARSVLDHLQSDAVEVRVFYVAGGGDRAYAVEGAQLYSNTPSDFDYALRAQESLTLEELAAELAATVDLAFPVIHGAFGEGGGLQALLEAAGVPFVGSDAEAARAAFHKARGAARIAAAGLPTVPLVALTAEDLDGDAAAAEAKLAAFFAARGLDPAAGAAVVKPASGGSSVGVTPTAGAAAALAAARDLVQARGLDAEVVVEPYVRGREFTVNVLETANGPVALMPSEVEFVAGDAAGNLGLRCFWEEEEEGGGEGGERDAAGGDGDALPIYDYRKKYLPTSQSRTHTPGRFSDGILKHIRASAERLFAELGLRDFARIDGWFVDEREAARLLDAPAPVLFTEVNIISGMEQNSFVFQQAANASLTHQALLLNIVQSACARHGLALNARGLHVPPVMLPLSAGDGTTTVDPRKVPTLTAGPPQHAARGRPGLHGVLPRVLPRVFGPVARAAGPGDAVPAVQPGAGVRQRRAPAELQPLGASVLQRDQGPVPGAGLPVGGRSQRDGRSPHVLRHAPVGRLRGAGKELGGGLQGAGENTRPPRREGRRTDFETKGQRQVLTTPIPGGGQALLQGDLLRPARGQVLRKPRCLLADVGRLPGVHRRLQGRHRQGRDLRPRVPPPGQGPVGAGRFPGGGARAGGGAGGRALQRGNRPGAPPGRPPLRPHRGGQGLRRDEPDEGPGPRGGNPEDDAGPRRGAHGRRGRARHRQPGPGPPLGTRRFEARQRLDRSLRGQQPGPVPEGGPRPSAEAREAGAEAQPGRSHLRHRVQDVQAGREGRREGTGGEHEARLRGGDRRDEGSPGIGPRHGRQPDEAGGRDLHHAGERAPAAQGVRGVHRGVDGRDRGPRRPEGRVFESVLCQPGDGENRWLCSSTAAATGGAAN